MKKQEIYDYINKWTPYIKKLANNSFNKKDECIDYINNQIIKNYEKIEMVNNQIIKWSFSKFIRNNTKEVVEMDENNDEIISKKARLNIVSNDYNILGENDEQIKENYELETTERLAKISKIFNKLTAKEKVIFNKMKNGDYSDKNGGYLMKKMQKLLGVKNE